jgi:hypothetical protein
MARLSGMKIVELGGIGPAPFCCMLLADMGADITRIDRIALTDSGIPMEKRYYLTKDEFAMVFRGRAVRIVLGRDRDHCPRWTAVVLTAGEIGCASQTLNKWLNKTERQWPLQRAH